MPYPESMVRLIEAFGRLPGVGARTAERFAYFILNRPREEMDALCRLILKVNGNIHSCQTCFNLSEEPVCQVCADPTRDHSAICVVQDPKDVISVEKAGDYRGVYHVLLGALSPLEGIGPDDLKIEGLLSRVGNGVIEIILATNPNVEGEATAIYLARLLKPLGVKVTRIAMGVPVGSDLEYADEVTMHKALEGRREV